jgi:hypothetical protein
MAAYVANRCKDMRRQNYLTTKRYINMTGRLDSVVGSLHVPAVLTKK